MNKDNMARKTEIRFITDSDLKESIATHILTDLPQWFGLPESTKEYIEQSQQMPFFAAYQSDKPVGFIVLKESSKYTAELFVMGVLKEYHRQQVGEQLYSEFVDYAKDNGYEYLQVKTVDEGHYEIYDRTRLFYEKMNFRKLECFPDLWDKHNPCLVMVQSVDAALANLKSKKEVS